MLERDKIQKAIKAVGEFLTAGKKLTNFSLLEICKKQGLEIIGTDAQAHIAHEIMEVAVNNYILNNFQRKNRTNLEILDELKAIEDKIPPQSWRGSEQKKLQQFSTPPRIAYLLAKILNPGAGELIIEPSAGTGSLAVWLRLAGCKIHVNELSATRREFLELQGHHPTGLNAEFLDDLLPEKIAPDGVLMNPPFSAGGGGRVKSNDSNFGFRHVKSALKRLKPGGRLVALLGSDTVNKSDKGKRFIGEIAADYELKAVITLPKTAYYKYGTSFQTCIVCIKKPDAHAGEKKASQRSDILRANCRNLEECLAFVNIFSR